MTRWASHRLELHWVILDFRNCPFLAWCPLHLVGKGQTISGIQWGECSELCAENRESNDQCASQQKMFRKFEAVLWLGLFFGVYCCYWGGFGCFWFFFLGRVGCNFFFFFGANCAISYPLFPVCVDALDILQAYRQRSYNLHRKVLESSVFNNHPCTVWWQNWKYFSEVCSTLSKNRCEITFGFCYEASIGAVSLWVNAVNHSMRETCDVSS